MMPTSARMDPSPDLLRDLADPGVALKAARKEARALEKELSALAKRGAVVSTDLTKRMAEARGRVGALETLRKRERDLYRNQRELQQFGGFMKAIVGGQLVRKMLRGETPTVGDAGQLAFVFEREIAQGLRQSLGRKMSGPLRRLLKAVPFIADATEGIYAGIQRVGEEREAERDIGRLYGEGKLSTQAFEASMTPRWDLGAFGRNNPEDALKLLRAADAARTLTEGEVRKALTTATRRVDFEYGGPAIGPGAVPVAGFKHTDKSAEIYEHIRAEEDRRRAYYRFLGVSVTPKLADEIFRLSMLEAVSKIDPSRKDEIAKELAVAVKNHREPAPDQDPGLQFRLWDEQKRLHAALAARIVPAKLED